MTYKGHASAGELTKTFYEYMLKLWLYDDRQDDQLLNIYMDAIKGLNQRMLSKSKTCLYFIWEYSYSFMPRMSQSSCFAGALYALTSMYVNSLDQKDKENYEDLTKQITNTCHESFAQTPTHLGPEYLNFREKDIVPLARYYILRPEVVESYLYLYRLTKDEMYRDWAWELVIAIETYCKTPNGYTGIKDVSNTKRTAANSDDIQHSYFLSATLKYLYLIFSDETFYSFNDYVFNSDAHPILINKMF